MEYTACSASCIFVWYSTCTVPFICGSWLSCQWAICCASISHLETLFQWSGPSDLCSLCRILFLVNVDAHTSVLTQDCNLPVKYACPRLQEPDSAAPGLESTTQRAPKNPRGVLIRFRHYAGRANLAATGHEGWQFQSPALHMCMLH